jgi:uncharacterized protein
MNCPVCNVALVMSDRQGIEIDYCPKCRGVWLDRGELDKIIERSSTTATSEQYQYNQPHEKYDDDDDAKYHGQRRHKRKSLLGDIFDFD